MLPLVGILTHIIDWSVLMKVHILFPFALLILLLSGCAKHEMVLDLKEDDSAQFEMTVSVDTTQVPFGESELRREIAEASQEAEKEGFTVQVIDEETEAGLIVSRTIEDVTQLEADDLIDDAAEFIEVQALDHHTRVLNIQFTGEEDEMAAAMLDSSLVVHFPSVPVSHNAHSEDGQTLTWYIDVAEGTEVHAEYETGSSTSMLLIAGIIAILLGGIAVLLLKRKNPRKDEAQPPKQTA